MTKRAVVSINEGAITEYSGFLTVYENVHTLLQQAVTVDDLKSVLNMAESLRLLAKKAGLLLGSQNLCAKIRIDTERELGKRIANNPDFGRGKKSVTVTDLGIGHNDSKRWQREASVPDEKYEAWATEVLERGKEELTSHALRQLARTVAAQDPVVRPPLHVVSDGQGLPGITGSFSTIVADPPWQYGNTSTRNAAHKHYPTMTIEDLCNLKVEVHAAENAHLYLWATAPLLREAFDVMEAWGFTYKTNLVWIKPQMGMGNYFRVSHEHVLFGVRGLAPILPATRTMSWFKANRGRHSAKPDSFLDIVERCSPSPGLEMFNRRRRMTAGFDWTYWGNES